MKKQAYLLFFLLFFFVSAIAQPPSGKEANIWYFGYYAGLDFNYSPPRVLLDGQTDHSGGFASVADHNGNLLFYTSPDSVLDRNHQPMPNTPNLGRPGSSNNVVVVPWPQNPGKYFIFSAYGSLYYSVVDMSLNGGLGDIMATHKQDTILNPINPLRGVTAVHHKNRRDIWVISYEFLTNKYYSFLVTPTGVSASPVINQVGLVSRQNDAAAFKISPDGNTIAQVIVKTTPTWSPAYFQRSIQLLGFDPNNGAMTDKGVLADTLSTSLEFSPDGSFLYASGDGYISGRPWSIRYNYLWQYDLSLPSPAAIFTNRALIASNVGYGPFHPAYGFMQAGPDGKIYMTIANNFTHTSNADYVGVIHRPNEKGTAAQFIANAINVNPDNRQPIARSSALAFPNFIQSYFFKPSIYLRQMCQGDTAYFSINNRGYVDSVKWDFGDPASGAFNTSTAFNPAHFYAAGGNYNVQVIAYYQFGSDTLNQTFFVPTIIQQPQLGADTVLCQGDTLLLNAFQPGNVSYFWQDSTTVDSMFVVTQPGTYWVEVSNGCGTRRDSINVQFNTPFSVNLGPNRVLCQGQTTTLTVNSPQSTFLWQDSTTGSSFTVTQPGMYWVEVRNACLISRDSIVVDFRSPPPPNILGSDTSFCFVTNYQLNATAPFANSYLWSTGSTDSVLTVNSSGTYWVQFQTICGTYRDSVTVTYTNPAIVSLGADTTLCAGETKNLSLNVAGATYLWQDSTSNSSFRVTQPGLYWVEVSTAAGCISRDSITVNYHPLPKFSLGADAVLCPGAVLALTIPVTADSYLWQDGSTSKTYTITQPGLYWAEIARNGCNYRDSVNVTIQDCLDKLIIPNIITPNNDNVNDNWVIKGVQAGKLEVQVYNRWGSQVYQTSSYKNNWQAEGLSEGTYFYLIRHPESGKTYKGWLEIVR